MQTGVGYITNDLARSVSIWSGNSNKGYEDMFKNRQVGTCMHKRTHAHTHIFTEGSWRVLQSQATENQEGICY